MRTETLSITHKAEKASNPLVGSSRKTSGGEWTTPGARQCGTILDARFTVPESTLQCGRWQDGLRPRNQFYHVYSSLSTSTAAVDDGWVSS